MHIFLGLISKQTFHFGFSLRSVDQKNIYSNFFSATYVPEKEDNTSTFVHFTSPVFSTTHNLQLSINVCHVTLAAPWELFIRIHNFLISKF